MSPDNRYVLAGDDNTKSYIWQAYGNYSRRYIWNMYDGMPIGMNPKTDEMDWYGKGLIPMPKNFISLDYPDIKDPLIAVQSLNFIDKIHFLRFTNSVPYAVLYNVNDLKPIKYFYLGLDPIPSVGDYELDEAIATSPESHVLVVADLFGNLIQYQYNPETMTLHKVMVNYLYKKQR